MANRHAKIAVILPTIVLGCLSIGLVSIYFNAPNVEIGNEILQGSPTGPVGSSDAPSVVYPGSGDVWKAGSIKLIVWTAAPYGSSVDIAIMGSIGTPWIRIATGLINVKAVTYCSHQWTVGQTVTGSITSGTWKIEVQDSSNSRTTSSQGWVTWMHSSTRSGGSA